MYIKLISSILLLLILDFLWIYLFMGPRYMSQIEIIQKSPMKVNVWYAIIAYIFMVIGLLIFCLPNINKKKRFKSSLIYGFLFGLVLYGVYDFTIASVIKKWDIKTAIIDIIWGASLFGFVCLISSFIPN